MLVRALLCLLTVESVWCLRTVCYWNGKSHTREGIGQVRVEHLKPALAYCTHLVYGFATLDDQTFQILPIGHKADAEKERGQWRTVTALKKQFPRLTVILSLGGNEDVNHVDKYLKVLEKAEWRAKLIDSIAGTLEQYEFDGIDLAWQFPPQHEKYSSISLSSIWHKFKKSMGYGVDRKVSDHRNQFVALIRELKTALKPMVRQLSIAVLPHINASNYLDVRKLMPHVDSVNLWTVDYRTPYRSPWKADHCAPLKFAYPRIMSQNTEFTVTHWLWNGADASKINMGIATWGRTWKLTPESGLSGVPPVTANGPGAQGPYTRTEGLLAYYETCPRLKSLEEVKVPAGTLRRVKDTISRLGTYGYELTQPSSNQPDGVWVSFEEPQTAAGKALYARQIGLGGVAVLDIAMDDTRGTCGTVYPITKAAHTNFHVMLAVGPPSKVPSSATWAAQSTTSNTTERQMVNMPGIIF